LNASVTERGQKATEGRFQGVKIKPGDEPVETILASLVNDRSVETFYAKQMPASYRRVRVSLRAAGRR
jgi:hypothetical protein